MSSLTLERRSSSGSQLTTHKWGTVVEALLLVGICFALIAETSGCDSKQALTAGGVAQSLSRLSASLTVEMVLQSLPMRVRARDSGPEIRLSARQLCGLRASFVKARERAVYLHCSILTVRPRGPLGSD